MDHSSVTLLQGNEVLEIIKDKQFLLQWQSIYDSYKYATIFQHPSFVCTWYKTYQEEWNPVILVSSQIDGLINGLWFLAYNKTLQKLVHAGAHQAEYQVWLSKENEEIVFLTRAFELVKSNFRFREIHFKYLPGIELFEILKSINWAKRCAVGNNFRRPLIITSDKNANQHSKRTRQRINQLAKLGNLEFKRIQTIEEFDAVFDEFVLLNNYRMGAIKGVLPFHKDKLKQKFHRNLFLANPESFMVTVTYLNGIPIAGEFAGYDKNNVCLFLGMLSPFLRKYSPGIIHIIGLIEYAKNENIAVVDLTPGGDAWKERYSTTHDNVSYAIIYKSILSKIRHEFRSITWNSIKQMLKKAGIESDKLKTEFSIWLLSFKTLLKIIRYRKWKSFDREILLFKYSSLNQQSGIQSEEYKIKINSISNFLNFTQGNHLTTQSEFLSGTYKSIEAGADSFSISKNDCLLMNIWVLRDQVSFKSKELKEPIEFPNPGNVIFDIYVNSGVLSQERALSLLNLLLKDILGHLNSNKIYVWVAAKDKFTLQLFQAIGCQYQRSYYCDFSSML